MKIGVVIQGQLNNFFMLSRHVEALRRFVDPEDIMVSTWDDQTIQNDLGVNFLQSDIKAVKGGCDHFEFINQNNKFYQIYTAGAGIAELLRRKNYDYIIKVRTDEYFEDYSELINRLQDDDRIHCSSIFFRNNFPYHIGDHLMAGPAGEMEAFFRSVLTRFIEIKDQEEFILKECRDKRYQRAIFPEDSQLNDFFWWTPDTLPPETNFVLLYLWSKGYEARVEDHVALMTQHFRPIAVEHFNKFSINSNTLKIELNHDTIDSMEHQILDSHLACTGCMDEILCGKRAHQALLLILFRGLTKENEDLHDLNDAAYNYNSLRAPWRVLDEFKWRIQL